MFDFNLKNELDRTSGSQSDDLGPPVNWQDSLKSCLRTHSELEDFFETDIPQIDYAVQIPRKLAIKIKRSKKGSPLWNQFLPSFLETQDEIQRAGLADPIGDEVHHQDGQIVHRYHNRLLFLPTKNCAGICRFCFRKNNIENDSKIFDSNFSATLDYLKNHLEVEELIFSGGDPFLLTDERIAYYMTQFSENTLLRHIRFHTRIPTFMPERVTDKLFGILSEFSKKFTKINIVVHINHPDELDHEVVASIKRLKDAGVDVLSQTVLLKGVNDDPLVLKSLIDKLLLAGIRPYYLHHPDRVKGGMHFYMDLEKGRKIFASLRNLVPGWAIPQYIIDIPGGQGKTNAFNPESFESSGRFITKDGKIVKINYQ
ncbi:MAG: KamA family radical SAM protein [Bacteriovoracaceae bacterium]|nr:KamA family radical SAM protein [Bacteriovoracaceae bacterium]